MQVWVKERGVGVCVYGCLHIWVVVVHVWGYVVHVGGECAMYDLGVCVHVCIMCVCVWFVGGYIYTRSAYRSHESTLICSLAVSERLLFRTQFN